MDEEIKQLLEKNLELTGEIHKMTKTIKNYVVFQRIMSLIYLLIIVIPIIIGFIYLPPILKNLFNQYQSLMGGAPIKSLSELLENSSTAGQPPNADFTAPDLSQ